MGHKSVDNCQKTTKHLVKTLIKTEEVKHYAEKNQAVPESRQNLGAPSLPGLKNKTVCI